MGASSAGLGGSAFRVRCAARGHAESSAAAAPLPDHGIVNVVAPAKTQAIRRCPDIQAGLRNPDTRRADSKASRTVLLPRRELARAVEKVGEPEIVHDHRAQYAGEPQQAQVPPAQI